MPWPLVWCRPRGAGGGVQLGGQRTRNRPPKNVSVPLSGQRLENPTATQQAPASSAFRRTEHPKQSK